jgi:hypothetical protein
MDEGRTISDVDRMIANKKLKEMKGEGSKNVSAMDREQFNEIMRMFEEKQRRERELQGNESGKNISNEDRARAEEQYMKRNDGGMAMSGRGKPVRTF